MKEIRTTFYELRSYFVPGCIMLWAILELFDLTGYKATTLVISSLSPTTKGILFIVLAYVIGHGLHAVANFTIDKLPFASYPPKDYFDGTFQKDFSPEAIESLFKAVSRLKGLQNPNSVDATKIIKNAYWICFQFVMNLQNAETENFLGLTGFYRGITSAMLAIAACYLGAFLKFQKSEILLIGFVAILLCGLFLTRVKRFGNYLAKTVYSNFLHLYSDKSLHD